MILRNILIIGMFYPKEINQLFTSVVVACDSGTVDNTAGFTVELFRCFFQTFFVFTTVNHPPDEKFPHVGKTSIEPTLL